MWRTDPIVTVVSHRVIAGGACDFEDDPLAVEMYDLRTRMWETCESMTAIFKDSAASTWLSTVVRGNKMYVAEKSSGVAYWFDPETKSWYGPYNLCPQRNTCISAIAFADDRVILIGLIGDNEQEVLCREIGEMPKQLVAKLRGELFSMSSAVINVMGNFAYIINTSAPEEVVLCDVRNVVVNDQSLLMERLVFTCANVGLGDLHGAIMAEDSQFAVLGRAGELL
ncbi:hypothetical protein P3X46_011680 [Hevea brasiliensis]|uniref:Uncharacterized protein n=1 Tax=Hevea brasiliensis TaxID=3981 RepID=A0ABQ9MAB7_HEVBR|nr:hypothetical protein P3X46_011680 [Hevea brasiliensis]